MKTIGIFDVIGPNMIGPSSSHTAGALKISLLARKMCEDKIKKAEFTLYGSFAETYSGHGTDRALIAGILGYSAEDMRIRNSFEHAHVTGVAYSFFLDKERRDVHPNTVDIVLTSEKDECITVTGVSIGGGQAEIRNINGIDVNFTGEYCTVIIKHVDIPGVIAYITKCFSDKNINIASLKLYRENKGKNAYAIVEIDNSIDSSLVKEIKSHSHITNAIFIDPSIM